jgi:RNA-directed DNA polymerase
MHSLPRGTLERIADPENLWHAWRSAARGKRRTSAVARYALNVDRDLFALRRELLAGIWRPRPLRPRIVYDPKPRLIAAPAVRDRVVHQALLMVIGPHFTARAIDTHFTRGAGVGVHQAVIGFLALNRRHAWRLHLDVQRYFPSIDHAVLRTLLCREIRDPGVCCIIDAILASGLAVYRSEPARELGLMPSSGTTRPRGLPLGSWFSQWAGAYYLDGLDHFVKRRLKCPGYLRYMDDLVLLGDDAERLGQMGECVAQWLGQERRLALNPGFGQLVATREPAVFLGHRISHSGIGPSRRMRRRLKAHIRSAALQGPEALQRTLISYRGLMWVR